MLLGELGKLVRVPCNDSHDRFYIQAGEARASGYLRDRGFVVLGFRGGEELVTLEWVSDQLRHFVDLNPEFETPVDRLASWLARLDDDELDDE